MKNLKVRFFIYTIALLGLWFMVIKTESCNIKNDNGQIRFETKISENQIRAFQKDWEQDFLRINAAQRNNGNPLIAVNEFIDNNYGYEIENVLFKPTTASNQPFRLTKAGAIAYFIGNDIAYPDDEGFALKHWTDVKWENVGIMNSESNLAIAMGNYSFIDVDGNELKAEFTMCFKENADGDLKIVAHKSSVPYSS